MPNTIIKDITRLVEHQPAGVKSTDLIHLYEVSHVDIFRLGYNSNIVQIAEPFEACYSVSIVLICLNTLYWSGFSKVPLIP